MIIAMNRFSVVVESKLHLNQQKMVNIQVFITEKIKS